MFRSWRYYTRTGFEADGRNRSRAGTDGEDVRFFDESPFGDAGQGVVFDGVQPFSSKARRIERVLNCTFDADI